MRPFDLVVEGFNVNIGLHFCRILVFYLDGGTLGVGESITQPLSGDTVRPMEVPHCGTSPRHDDSRRSLVVLAHVQTMARWHEGPPKGARRKPL
eukprot:9052686-Alexandrium_andersonii.AAC.1